MFRRRESNHGQEPQIPVSPHPRAYGVEQRRTPDLGLERRGPGVSPHRTSTLRAGQYAGAGRLSQPIVRAEPGNALTLEGPRAMIAIGTVCEENDENTKTRFLELLHR